MIVRFLAYVGKETDISKFKSVDCEWANKSLAQSWKESLLNDI